MLIQVIQKVILCRTTLIARKLYLGALALTIIMNANSAQAKETCEELKWFSVCYEPNFIREKFKLNKLDQDYWLKYSKSEKKKYSRTLNILSDAQIKQGLSQHYPNTINPGKPRDEIWHQLLNEIPDYNHEMMNAQLTTLIFTRAMDEGDESGIMMMAEKPIIEVNLVDPTKVSLEVNQRNIRSLVNTLKRTFPAEAVNEMDFDLDEIEFDGPVDMEDLGSGFILSAYETAAFSEFIKIVKKFKERRYEKVFYFDEDRTANVPFVDKVGNIYLPFHFYFKSDENEKRAIIYHEALHAIEVPSLAYITTLLRRYRGESEESIMGDPLVISLLSSSLGNESFYDYRFIVYLRENPEIILGFKSVLERMVVLNSSDEELKHRLALFDAASKLSAKQIERIYKKMQNNDIPSILQNGSRLAYKKYGTYELTVEQSLSLMSELVLGSGANAKEKEFLQLHLKSSLSGAFDGAFNSPDIKPSERLEFQRSINEFWQEFDND